MNQEVFERHLEPAQVASYVDGTIQPSVRAAVQRHLATCEDCRAELVEVSRIMRSFPAARRARRHVWLPAAAAAAVVLVLAWPRAANTPVGTVHREEAVTTTVAPRPVTPIGAVASVSELVWSSVPYADRYHVRMFDGNGTVIWERETADTVATLPTSVSPRAEVSYFWKVEALTGFDRRAASGLVEFVVSRRSKR